MCEHHRGVVVEPGEIGCVLGVHHLMALFAGQFGDGLHRGGDGLVINALADKNIAATAADGVNVWINLATRAAPVVEALATFGWLVRDGAEFSLDDSDEAVNHIRVTIHQLTNAQLDQFVADLVEVVNK